MSCVLHDVDGVSLLLVVLLLHFLICCPLHLAICNSPQDDTNPLQVLPKRSNTQVSSEPCLKERPGLIQLSPLSPPPSASTFCSPVASILPEHVYWRLPEKELHRVFFSVKSWKTSFTHSPEATIATVLGSFMSTWHELSHLRGGNLNWENAPAGKPIEHF